MSKYKYLIVNRRGPITEVLLNRPEARNALSWALLQEWDSALDEAEDDEEVLVVTVRGLGPVFSAGGDIKEGAPGYVAEGIHSGIPKYRAPQLPRAWYFRKAIVAGVHGFVGPEANHFLGCCDFVIAAEDTKFSFEVLRAGGEGTATPIISMMLPMRVMLKLYLMGSWFDAEQALSWQYVNRVVQLQDLEGVMNRWAEELCKMPSQQIRAAKEYIHRIYEIKGLANLIGIGNHLSGHGAESDVEFYRILLDKGMREALRFRDSIFDPDLAKV